MRELLLIIALMMLGALIILGGDKQSVHMLEGKLHRQGKTTKPAQSVYRRHLKPSSLMQFVFGMGLVAVGIIFWVNDQKSLALVSGAFAAALCGWGAWGRIRSFLAADTELRP